MRDYSDELNSQKKNRRRRFLIGSVLFFVIVVGGGSIYLLFFTDIPYFARIEITGLRSLTQKDLFPGGDKIFLFANVSVTNPIIKRASIERDYMQRKLKISVEERDPYAIWCLVVSDTRASSTDTSHPPCYWFDREGVIFTDAPRTEGILIKGVDDVSGRILLPGNSVLGTEMLSKLWRIWGVLDLASIPVERFRLEPIEKEELTAFTRAGALIHFSLRVDPYFAVEPLKSVADDLDKLEYVDLRSENKVFYK